MVNRIVSVGDDFTLPASTKVADANLPTRLGATALNATFARNEVPDYAGPLTKGFDAARSAYNIKPSNSRRLRAALASARTSNGISSIAMVGDSETAGVKATALEAWPLTFRTALGVPVAGTGFAPAHAGTEDIRYTFTAGWVLGTLIAETVIAGEKITFVSDKPGTAVDVFYLDQSGTFSVAIDGGAPETVTPGMTDAVGRWSKFGLGNNVHTVVITTLTTTKVYINGVTIFKTGGLLVHNVGMSGAKTDTWTNPVWVGPQKISLKVGQAYATAAWFIALGVNDALTNTDVAVYKANLIELVALYKTQGDVIIVAQPQPQGVPIEVWKTYVTAAYEVADTWDVPLLDILDRWGDYNSANGAGYMFGAGDSGTHPNNVGFEDWGQAAAALALA